MLARIVTTQDHVVHAANVQQLGATGVGDRALNILLHFYQGFRELPFDGL